MWPSAMLQPSRAHNLVVGCKKTNTKNQRAPAQDRRPLGVKLFHSNPQGKGKVAEGFLNNQGLRSDPQEDKAATWGLWQGDADSASRQDDLPRVGEPDAFPRTYGQESHSPEQWKWRVVVGGGS